MRRQILNSHTLILLALLLNCLSLRAAGSSGSMDNKVDFNRDIRSIFSDNCYTCHGPDSEKRKAGLRLDRQESALSELKSGNHAVVPGKPEKSALISRITTSDDDERMPPKKTGKTLSPEQINMLRRWIAEGAQWKKHWSFISPERPGPPVVKNLRWPRNEIDRFILARLEQNNLAPSPEAKQTTLIRRVTLDLTGLPPTPTEVDAFLADRRPDAYEQLVERLMASPRFGEHMGRYWLDAARYGDTHGLHLDNERSLWPYRDWVIAAFNKNMPFDQFTIEQLAGDLLPSATKDQRVATGFNRCNVTTSEGGAIDEEFYVRYAVDRTETTASVFMGLTVGCAVCHDHKYDPITQKEFYQLFAFFNNNREQAMDGNALLPPPILKLPTKEQEATLAKLNEDLGPIEKRIHEEAAKIKYSEPPREPKPATDGPAEFVWIEDDFPPGANAQINGGTAERFWNETNVFSGKRALMRTDKGVAQDYFTSATRPMLVGKGDVLFAYAYLDPANPPKAIMLQYHTSEWLHRANWGDADAIAYGDKGTSQKVQIGELPATGKWVRLEVEVSRLELKPGAKIDGISFTQSGGTVFWDHAGIMTSTPQEDLSLVSESAWEQQQKAKEPGGVPANILAALKTARNKRTPEQKSLLRDYYIAYVYGPTRATFDPLLKQIAAKKKERDDLENSLSATMVMQELETNRTAYILKRGEYDKRREPVTRGVPAVLPPLPQSDTTNRLDFARWLVGKEHPLTARVEVNRLWQQFFGTGLVKSSQDFGSQGEWPSHSELLDWLAVEFRDGPISAPGTGPNTSARAWDIKHIVRLIVTSASYRQDSKVSREKLQADPENRLLARGPRFRLDAEVIRDNALYVSGLMVEKVGGHSVKPYQPEGIWEAVGYTTSNTAKFSQDHGEALYRRSLYTFWKRTAAPPTLITFDAPSRERFCVRRERTDTPLQALITMNDIQFVEAARHFAERMLTKGSSAVERLDYGFEAVTARHPSAREKAVLKNALEKHLLKYQGDEVAARQLIEVGESPASKEIKPAELAAYTMVASLLLNLDETLNKN